MNLTRRDFFSAPVAAGACSAALAACGSGVEGLKTGAQQLTLGVGSFPTTGLSMVSKNSWNRNIRRLLFDPLIGMDNKNAFFPVLAERLERTTATHWRLTIRPGITFADGSPLTTGDVVRAITAMQEPIAQPYPGVQGWRNVAATDDHTVEFDTTDPQTGAPSPDLLVEHEMADICFVGSAAYEKANDRARLALTAMGTGPYQLRSFDPGSRLTADANPHYWGGRPLFDRVVLRAIPDSNTRVAALLSGAADIVPIDLNQIARVERGKDVYVTSAREQRAWITQINFRNAALRDVRVRRAFNYAVDKEALIKAFFNGRGAPIASYAIPGAFGKDESVEPYPYDPDKARALLTEANWDFDTVLVNGVNESYRDVCLAVGEFLGAVGLKIRSNVLDAAKYQERQRTGAVGDLFTVPFIITASDMTFMYSQNVLSTSPVNFNKFSDPAIDANIREALRTIDPAKREAIVKTVDGMVHRNPPFIFLLNSEAAYGVSNRIKWSARRDGVIDVMRDVRLA